MSTNTRYLLRSGEFEEVLDATAEMIEKDPDFQSLYMIGLAAYLCWQSQEWP